MKLLLVVSVIASTVIRSNARSLRSGVAVLDLDRGQRVLPLNFNLEDCYADPSTCGGAMDSLNNLSKTLSNKVMAERNQSMQLVIQAMQSFVACTPKFTTTRKAYLASLRKAARDHKTCRLDQLAKYRRQSGCASVKSKAARLKNIACTDSTLTQQPAAGVCKAPVNAKVSKRQVRTYYQNMMTQFLAKKRHYTRKYATCQQAMKQHQSIVAKCDRDTAAYKEKVVKCDYKLTNIEEMSCAWATKSEDRRKAYDTCFKAALKGFNAVKSSLASTKELTKQDWAMAMRMKCMAAAVDSTGNVDVTKMKGCNSLSTDFSAIDVKLAAPPVKHSYHSPSVYPGSRSYYKMVYKPLHWRARKQARPAKLCLEWKGGCYARSTFANHPVHLKFGGQYCFLNRGEVDCRKTRPGRSRKTKFAFVSHRANCSSAILAVVNKWGKVKRFCRFEPSARDPHIKCYVKDNNARVTISSNPPAASRSNKITMKLDQVTGSAMGITPFKAGARCGTVGALTELMAMPIRGSRSKNKAWSGKCLLFPSGAGFMRFKWGGYVNAWRGKLLVNCKTGWILAGTHTRSSSSQNDQRYKWPCLKLPPGMMVKSEGSWMPWSKSGEGWKSKCGVNQVMTGLESTYDLKAKDRTWRSRCAEIALRTPKSTVFEVKYSRIGR